mgnify:CR=1 FL=1|nr:MAG TPA: Cytosine specific methyltransferase [Caudoviricetes sp.]
MKHLGDITLVRGDEIEPVNCIIGGSPCQDLSVAGKRAGLSGARSGLFMEQIRIVKEMRRKYGKPRYMVWENVPGAFSSNRGEDFRIVLEEIVKVVDESATVPQPPKGRWAYAGCVVGDGYSVAWRVHDAQFWGVPQRRRRIALVADFGGESAPEILFERDSVSGDSEAGREARKGAAGTAPGCIGITNRGSVAGVASETLRSGSHGALPMVTKMYAVDAVSSNSMKSANPHSGFHDEDVAKTLQAGGVDPTCNQGGNVIVQPVICLQGNGIDRADTAGCNGRGWRENVSYTLNTIDRPAVCYDMTHASDVIRDCGEVSPTLQSRMGTGGNQIPLCIGNGQADQLRCQTSVGALNCMHDQQCVVSTGVVRRLTPLECERLQGFPDGWTDIGDWVDSKGKKHKSADAPRYKALGNSIALPFWLWMLHRMSEYLPARATMGSLFDGIGGFPLCWETIHGKGSARWASEIEEFPIAVTKLRFPEDVTKL